MTILDRIVKSKRDEVDRTKATRPPGEVRRLADRAEPPRDFAAAVTGADGGRVNLIAEIKRASPSAGVIVEDFDPVKIATIYEQAGASALSVLTDEPFFDGRLSYVADVKQIASLPVLRKDFLVDPYQVYESRAAGADCILLIADVLSGEQIESFHSLARSLHLAVLVEVHAQADLDAVLSRLGPPASDHYLLGINNRNLAVQRTDLAVCERLGAKLPSNTGFVAESGIATHKDVERIRRAGATAMLVGESLLRADNTTAHIRDLLGPL